jgi:hypothetical protein
MCGWRAISPGVSYSYCNIISVTSACKSHHPLLHTQALQDVNKALKHRSSPYAITSVPKTERGFESHGKMLEASAAALAGARLPLDDGSARGVGTPLPAGRRSPPHGLPDSIDSQQVHQEAQVQHKEASGGGGHETAAVMLEPGAGEQQQQQCTSSESNPNSTFGGDGCDPAAVGKKRRGRPRKSGSSAPCVAVGQDDGARLSPLSADLAGALRNQTPLSGLKSEDRSVGSLDATDNVPSTISKPKRGRPRKKPTVGGPQLQEQQ